MAINIYEKAVKPIVDLDTDVVVYVPGFATMGPTEPTLVTRDNFTSVFGTKPYIFNAQQVSSAGNTKNSILAHSPDRSWLYAKGLVDSGLTVLFKRIYPTDIAPASSETAIQLLSATNISKLSPITGKTFKVMAKYYGTYYSGLQVVITPNQSNVGISTVTVSKNEKVLETRSISFNPSSPIYVDSVEFDYIKFFIGAESDPSDFQSLDLATWYADSDNAGKFIYANQTILLEVDLEDTLDEVTVDLFEESVSGSTEVSSVLDEILDTEKYRTISYITTSGYYQTSAMASRLESVAWDIKAIALIDLPNDVHNGYSSLKNSLAALEGSTEAKGKSATFVGADTFTLSGYRVVLADSFGYLQRLGNNISASIPYWIPAANNPNGVVTASATTRPVSNVVRIEMQTKEGVSCNPIIYKQNVGYTIMGNRTLAQNDGVLGPNSFLNCQIVVNAIERAARRSAQDLLIVSTDPNTAFRTFKIQVSKTCDKMLVNGDGLAAYKIYKLKKTQPATIDTVIELTVREGIEEWNITVPYTLELGN